MIQKRSTLTCVLLSLVTCGIYGIYWWYCVASEIHDSNAPEAPQASPGTMLLLNIITCGIYGVYVYYKWGKAMQQMYAARGMYGEDRSILYLVLSLLGLSIVNMALLQEDLNTLADAPPPVNGPGGYNPYGGQPGQPPYGGGPAYNAQGAPVYGQQPYGAQTYAPAPGQAYAPERQPYAPVAPQPPYAPAEPAAPAAAPEPANPYAAQPSTPPASPFDLNVEQKADPFAEPAVPPAPQAPDPFAPPSYTDPYQGAPSGENGYNSPPPNSPYNP